MATHTAIPNSGYLQMGLESLTVRYAFDNISAGQTDDAIVAAAPAKKLRVIALVCECGATGTNITFNSKGSGAGTAISMTFQNAANGGAVLGLNEQGWFETSSGEALTATTGAGSTTGVQVVYVEVPTT